MEQQYSGSCHCGAVRFEAKADLDTAIKCNCSLCRKKNATMVRIPSENFKLIEGRRPTWPLSMEHKSRKALFLQELRHLYIPPPTNGARLIWT